MGQVYAGQLRERITLLTPSSGLPDGRGGYTAAGPEQANAVWARVVPVSGSEKLRLGQTLDSEVYRVTVRRPVEAFAKQRLTWRGKTLGITAVLNEENNEFQSLLCIDSGQ